MIHHSAIIYDNVVIEDDVYIGPYCIIGSPPEKKGAQESKGVIIKKGTIIHGAVTIDSGFQNPTEIGENCYIMKQVHIGHDALLKDNVTIAPHATVGGHCIIGEGVGIGMNASVHQFVIVKDDCFLGQGTVLPRDFKTVENGKYVGVGRFIGNNK
jgi:UDP-N-acetylglucosamine acyltransferase